MIQLKDVIHLYLGCAVRTPDGDMILSGIERKELFDVYWLKDEYGSTVDTEEFFWDEDHGHCKPILRSLSDMTKDEQAEHEKIYFADTFKLMPWYHDTKFISMTWFLKNGFDLFGLIESNQAIDKTKLPITP